MLVLSRKLGEKLVIGDNITVVISRVAGNRVTLGIEAPSNVRIVRGELRQNSKWKFQRPVPAAVSKSKPMQRSPRCRGWRSSPRVPAVCPRYARACFAALRIASATRLMTPDGSSKTG